MSTIVFVHGVSTRTTPEYDIQKENRISLFKTAVFGDASIFLSPMWGDHVPQLLFDGASFRKSETLDLAIGDPTPQPAGDTIVLPAIAKGAPSSALDLLISERIRMVDNSKQPLSPEDLALFGRIVDLLDAETQNPSEATTAALRGLQKAVTDQEFVSEVNKLSDAPHHLGIVDMLTSAKDAIVDRAASLTAKGLHSTVVERLNPSVARFLGDVFLYLKEGKIREEIRTTVGDAIRTAWENRNGGKVIVIGHSLGGVILYDMLSDLKSADLPEDLKVDALITVGSQPGLFQELGLFASTASLPAKTAARGPDAASLWFNVFDPIDVFGFSAKPMFARAEDYSFNTITGLASAHSAYFTRPQFYARLRRRLVDAGVI
ncbi:hypothetical protein [Sinorhizobium meliloti]|uniref:hypothetical protein n=1 Tax=Rhizobium meliloti TaxID=382 RepID=UPI00299CFB6F|nr:hypothetical protein [Sinorhizobium meliloti]MDX0154703.1 hypothetical protein [Sinorhizobium meliloti]MDX0177659.1 hypothetical protein [Sinorhizobium meliloti]